MLEILCGQWRDGTELALSKCFMLPTDPAQKCLARVVATETGWENGLGHPNRSATPLVGALYDAWRAGEIRMVRSPGGSPSWALLEAATGRFVYTNLWSKSRAEPYDLAAGVLLVRKAGGEVVNLEGEPIDAVGHQGPFVAAVDAANRQVVVDIAREVVGLGA